MRDWHRRIAAAAAAAVAGMAAIWKNARWLIVVGEEVGDEEKGESAVEVVLFVVILLAVRNSERCAREDRDC